MTEKYILKHEVFFHPETHTYLPSKEEYDKFCEKLEIYREKKLAEGVEPNIRYWANSQGWRYGKLTSTTTLLGKIFPFTGGDDFITKAWLTKIHKKGNLPFDLLESFTTAIDNMRDYMNRDVEESQVLGTEAHEAIQDWMEEAIKNGGDTSGDIGVNKYALAFKAAVLEKKKLQELIGSISELLPCETPVAYWSEKEQKHLFTGMWDGLWKTNKGEHYLIDIKTGSEVKADKKLKVEHQLNAYNNLVMNNLGIKVDKHICLEVSQVWNTYSNKWEIKVKAHYFEPDPDSFFEMLDTFNKLETLKKGSEA